RLRPSLHLRCSRAVLFGVFVFLAVTASTQIYTLSLHDALPIFGLRMRGFEDRVRGFPGGSVVGAAAGAPAEAGGGGAVGHRNRVDRKSTRLNSSHVKISYAVFCLKKKKK